MQDLDFKPITEEGVPAGYEGPNGVRLFDPGVVIFRAACGPDPTPYLGHGEFTRRVPCDLTRRMITAPKCKVCGNAHWGTCYTPPERTAKRAVLPAADAQLEGGKKRATDFPVSTGDGLPTAEPGANASKGVTGGESAASTSKRGRKPTGFDKKAYDRETAKARRAAKKEAKPK